MFFQIFKIYLNFYHKTSVSTVAFQIDFCINIAQQQGRANDLSKDYVQAKEDGKHLVSPHWLRACAQSRERMKEKEYPITYNPRMSLDVMTSSSPAVVKNAEKQVPQSNVCFSFIHLKIMVYPYFSRLY